MRAPSNVPVAAYRPDVDGLRALAILSVVAFHYKIPGGTGGFVGVDVFFVISGFLITSLIDSQLRRNEFRFREFWARRARRVLPPLVVVAACCAIAGWYFSLPSQYQRLGEQVLSQSLFVPNFLFWATSGYFDFAAESKPLLHTWSLGVEEQFYLFFPLLMVILFRVARRGRANAIVGLAVLSFAIAAVAVPISSYFAFYLLPARAWELLAGSIVAIVEPPRLAPRALREAAAILGLAAIAAAVVLYDAQTPFPGPAALLPVLGTAAIIASGRGEPTTVARVFSLRPIVGIGLISYGLYLWHWPLLVFFKSVTLSDLTAWQRTGLFAASVGAAWLSYAFLEQPIRHRRVLKTDRALALASVGSLAVLAVAGTTIHAGGGFPGRFSAEIGALEQATSDAVSRESECRALDERDGPHPDLCRLGEVESDRRILFVGDSYIESFLPTFSRLSRRYGVEALFNVTKGLRLPDVADAARALGVSRVVFVYSWSRAYNPYGVTEFRPETSDAYMSRFASDRAFLDRLGHDLGEVAERFRRAGADVYALDSIPLYRESIPEALALLRHRGADLASYGKPMAEYLESSDPINRVLAQKLGENHLLRAERVLCRDGKLCRTWQDGRPLYMDGAHLSLAGASLFEESFERIFQDPGAN